MIGVPVGIAVVAAVAYFATRPTENGPSGDCQDGQVMYQQCPDGSQIMTYQCINGVWVATGNQCAEPPPPGCQDGYVLYETCPDGSQIITHQCINGQWIPTGNQCAAPPPPPPECSPEGQYKSVCCFNYKQPLYYEQCTGGQWEPTGNECNPAGHHSHEICGQQHLTPDMWYMWYETTHQGETLPKATFYNHETGYYTALSFFHSHAELIQTLEYYYDRGAINDTQYQIALAQAANMGFT